MYALSTISTISMDNRVLVLHDKWHTHIGGVVVYSPRTRYTGSMLTFAAVVSIVILVEAVAALALTVYWLKRLDRAADRLLRNTRWQLLGEGERDGSD